MSVCVPTSTSTSPEAAASRGRRVALLASAPTPLGDAELDQEKLIEGEPPSGALEVAVVVGEVCLGEGRGEPDQAVRLAKVGWQVIRDRRCVAVDDALDKVTD